MAGVRRFLASAAGRSRGVALSLCAALTPGLLGCASPSPPAPTAPPATYSCLLPTEQRMLVAELFFGRDIRGRGPLTDAEWNRFATAVVTPNFPEGFTVFDGGGQWRDPATRQIVREPVKILLAATRRSADLASRLRAVIEAYKTRYHQQAVGVITRDACAAF